MSTGSLFDDYLLPPEAGYAAAWERPYPPQGEQERTTRVWEREMVGMDTRSRPETGFPRIVPIYPGAVHVAPPDYQVGLDVVTVTDSGQPHGGRLTVVPGAAARSRASEAALQSDRPYRATRASRPSLKYEATRNLAAISFSGGDAA